MSASHYVIIDGCLQRNTPETAKWARRVSKALPGPTGEPEANPVVDLTDRRTDWEILQALDNEDDLGV